MIKKSNLRNTPILPLVVLPRRRLYLKYFLIALLVAFSWLASLRIYEVVTSPVSCNISTAYFNIDTVDRARNTLITRLANKYNQPTSTISKIVDTATIYALPTFPTRQDILAIIAIESRFNVTATNAISSAKGLMQILYKQSSTDIEHNIRDGVSLLKQYKEELGSEEAAIQAYNVGIGNYLKGVRATEYLSNFKREKAYIQ